ncbi:hypothetical protein P4N68_01740 [Corynebacterium felinum]|uniref:Uncharacterized protein n=1 Tax=Corynebacterium felinum TaxID=131318 RepID=A0ABU2BBP7_9CORY|nr:hypothetical protein [Corynebacterium felinum]MDF5819802.1 hypothetical protein [Corynebacterium felinum]MDR7356057.1 hypothetical protein [Corynebacterium felinum]
MLERTRLIARLKVKKLGGAQNKSSPSPESSARLEFFSPHHSSNSTFQAGGA